MKRNKLGTLRNKCDRLMQEIGQKRNKSCLLCGSPCQVMHHLVPKSVSSRLRYEWDNLVPLCNGCHMRLHQSGDPHYEYRIIQMRGGDKWYEGLRKMGQEIVKINMGYYEGVLEGLRAELGITDLPN